MTEINIKAIKSGDKVILESAGARIDGVVYSINHLAKGEWQIFIQNINVPFVLTGSPHSYWELTKHTPVKDFPTQIGSVITWNNASEVAILVYLVGHGSYWEYKGKNYKPYELSEIVGDSIWDVFVSKSQAEKDTKEAIRTYGFRINDAVNSQAIPWKEGDRKEDSKIYTARFRQIMETEANKLGITFK